MTPKSDSADAQGGRRLLASGWRVCNTPAGQFSNAPAACAEATQWLMGIAPSTVAAVLRANDAWRLDGEPRRFDAEDWWYRLQFAASPAELAGEPVLGFEGLATVAEVWLNGDLVLSSDNMFVAHELDVALQLRPENELLIRFRSLDALLAQRRPRPRWRASMVENQQLRWFRTTLLGRCPGWSPPVAPVGPWRPIWLRHTGNAPQLASHGVVAKLQGDHGLVQAECTFAIAPDQIAAVELVVRRADDCWTARMQYTQDGRWLGILELPSPEKWWPHTHGDPALYDAFVIVTGSRFGSKQLPLGAIGFRSVQAETAADNFALHVNGTRIFCRGACWTPLDVVSLQSDPELCHATLQKVRGAGMNMLRISGTMLYEHDIFYEECDRLGIMVWQDFMFASMDYPDSDELFAATVRTEARQQLRRLSRHPSIACFCGNSEAAQLSAMWGASRAAWSPALFHELLAEETRALAPDVPYWPSSAYGGSFPHEPRCGTVSYYGIGAYLRDVEDVRLSRVQFATECLGFANVPEPPSLRKLPGGSAVRAHHAGWKSRSPRDLGAGWDFDDVRDHYVRRMFKVDPLELRSTDHQRYLDLGRAAVGELMAATMGEWRRKDSSCNGALVWFLRDLWPGAGWGILDSDGCGKSPYFHLRRVLQPIGLHISDEGCNGLSVHLFNDKQHSVSGQLTLTIYRHGEQRIDTASCAVQVPARTAAEFPAAQLFGTWHDLSYAYRFGPLPFNVLIARWELGYGLPGCEAAYFPGGFASLACADVGLSATATPAGKGDYVLDVTTRAFAHGVIVETDGYAPDDQHFNLAPGARRLIRLQPELDRSARPPSGSIRCLNSGTLSNIRMAL